VSNGEIHPQALVGSWKKVGAPSCAEKYPETISFSTGTYRGTRGASQGMIWWDAGIYRIEGSNTLVIGTATDELIHYEISLQGDRLDVTDAEGCRFAYQRQSS
jgi:hypothetical protein